jgi:hypothetical protein
VSLEKEGGRDLGSTDFAFLGGKSMRMISSMLLVVSSVIGLTTAGIAAEYPPGDYQETCRTIQFNKDTGLLTAECQKSDESWQQTALALTVVNCNGQLTLAKDCPSQHCLNSQAAVKAYIEQCLQCAPSTECQILARQCPPPAAPCDTE